MRVRWNYYTDKGKAEGITMLNEVVVGYGTKEDCKELVSEQSYPPNSQSYSWSIQPCKSKPGQWCLHVKWNGFFD